VEDDTLAAVCELTRELLSKGKDDDGDNDDELVSKWL
jgi:hypothetical protein